MNNAEDILKKHWGYDRFRPGQKDIIASVLEGKDTLALLPTGGGKSVTYQVPAMMKDGLCIVVTPLIALMKDQVARLHKQKIKALSIHSGMTYHEIDIALDNAVYGGFKFLYVSPERLESDIFKAKAQNMPINLIAIDEAHCISQWGYDFRPSYLKIRNFRNSHPDIPVLALTATATPEVVDDIADKLDFKQKNIVKTPFTRENLVFTVRDMEDKNGHLLNSLKKINGSGIIYVRNRKNTKELAMMLKKNGVSADCYHAGLKNEIRNIRQQNWLEGKTRVICTTNAFGMGIDKPDVRFVVHYDVPDSLEEYVQEAGRAGRDGKKAFAALFCNASDKSKIKRRLPTNFPEITEIKKIYNALSNYFQIPVGTGKGMVFDFSLADFCSVYKFNALIAYNALKILQREGYIELTDELNNPSRVFFIVNRDDLYKFQVSNPNMDSFIKLLLRNYTGLFSNYVAIDETDLARKSGHTNDDIYGYLVKLSKLKILKYIPKKKTPLLVFEEERLDKKNLIISTENYKARKNRYEQRLNKVLEYAENTDRCRNTIILEYFGEKPGKNCGQCDICKKQIEVGIFKYEFEEIKSLIVKELKEKNMKTEDVDSISKYDHEKNIKTVRILLDSEIITYDKYHNLVLNKKLIG